MKTEISKGESMNKLRNCFWLICAIFCLTACTESTIELSHVKRIVASDAESFTLWHADSTDSPYLKVYQPKCLMDVQIVMDAAPEKDMWATVYHNGFWCFAEIRMTIHIHSAEEINGGGGG